MTMPKIGVNMVEGTVTEWLVAEGGEVKFGEMALRAETDKDIQDIPADQTGTVLKIVAQVGDTVECHHPLAIIGAPGENIDALLAEISGAPAAAPAPAAEAPAAAPAAAAPAAAPAPEAAPAPAGRINISPLAKKMAKEMGIDISKVKFSGPRITKKDILNYKPEPVAAAAPAAAPAAAAAVDGVAEVIPYGGLRKTIGNRMRDSVVTKPWAAITMAIDMSKTIAWRKQVNEIADVKVGFNEIIAKACARALRDFPKMNAQLAGDGKEIYMMKDVNVGIAVDTERGLFVPVVKNADTKGLAEMAKDFAGLVKRTREQTNIPGDLSGGTFTISNLGSAGVSNFRAIINPPEAGILAVSATIKTPVVIDDEIVIRPMMNVTLSFDHRIVDGAYAAKFLGRVKTLLQDPMQILI